MSQCLKFRCEHVDRTGPVGVAVTLTPIFPTTEGGKVFFCGAPVGKVQLEQLTADAASLFENGQEYFVNFSRVDALAAGKAQAAPAAVEPETPAATGETKPPEGETQPQQTT